MDGFKERKMRQSILGLFFPFLVDFVHRQRIRILRREMILLLEMMEIERRAGVKVERMKRRRSPNVSSSFSYPYPLVLRPVDRARKVTASND